MHKRRVLYFLEPAVHTILLRQLTTRDYRVYPKVKLSDAIGMDEGERLPAKLFGYFTRAHLDFLVVRNDVPVFAVEFDGRGHALPEAMERDAMKNRLCRAADLQLLRIRSVEIADSDRHSVLDYMLMRYVAWQDEIDGIAQELNDFAAGLPDGFDPEEYAVDFDPTVHFDLRHPFPGTAVVQDRLWKNHGIACGMTDLERTSSARLLCEVGNRRRMNSSPDDQFTICEMTASVWEPPSTWQSPIVQRDVSASIRTCLPLQVNVPGAPLAFVGSLRSTWFQDLDRFNALWFADLPGVSPWDIAENYAEYLGFRAIEKWAGASSLPPVQH